MICRKQPFHVTNISLHTLLHITFKRTLGTVLQLPSVRTQLWKHSTTTCLWITQIAWDLTVVLPRAPNRPPSAFTALFLALLEVTCPTEKTARSPVWQPETTHVIPESPSFKRKGASCQQWWQVVTSEVQDSGWEGPSSHCLPPCIGHPAATKASISVTWHWCLLKHC